LGGYSSPYIINYPMLFDLCWRDAIWLCKRKSEYISIINKESKKATRCFLKIERGEVARKRSQFDPWLEIDKSNSFSDELDNLCQEDCPATTPRGEAVKTQG